MNNDLLFEHEKKEKTINYHFIFSGNWWPKANGGPRQMPSKPSAKACPATELPRPSQIFKLKCFNLIGASYKVHKMHIEIWKSLELSSSKG